MATIGRANAASFNNTPRLQYISTAPFNNYFYSYSTSVTNFVTTGTLTSVSGSNSGNCPKGRVLRVNGRKLYPDANPGITTYMVGVYDAETFLSGFIDPNAKVFQIYNTDKPNYLADGVDPTTDTTNLGPSVYTRGDLLAEGNLDISGNGTIYGDLGVVGNVDISGNQKVHGDLGVVGNVDISGNQKVHGDLGVVGNVDISGNQKVHGDLGVVGNVDISGNQKVHGDLGVVGNVDISGSMQMYGALNVNNSITQFGFTFLPKFAIIMWGGNVASIPTGWLLCDGSTTTINGQPVQTPNLSGRFVLSYGQGPLNFPNTDVFATGGAQNHTLTVAEMPSHSHTQTTVNDDFNGTGTYPDTTTPSYAQYDTSGNIVWTETINNTGGDNPHNNMPPYIVLCYIMKGF